MDPISMDSLSREPISFLSILLTGLATLAVTFAKDKLTDSIKNTFDQLYENCMKWIEDKLIKKEKHKKYFRKIFKYEKTSQKAQTVNNTYIYQTESDSIQSKPLIKSSPYLGLNKFDEKDSAKFFGRNNWISELTKHLEEKNVLLLLGASGSGKSSLIRAGVIPNLTNNWGSFTNLTFMPDENPFESLYGRLMPIYGQSKAKIAKEVEEDTLVKVVKSLKQDDRWLIFIDQFEELFTRTQKSECDKFVASLVRLITESDSTVKIVITMRADFLDRFSTYPDLGTLHDQHGKMLTKMKDSELKSAITEPAKENGVSFEEGLVQRITDDFNKHAGSLPLLQYTLNLLWENDNIEDRVLNTKTYEELGGVNGALNQQANKIYQKLEQQEQEAAKKIFLKLVNLADGKSTNRRVKKSIFEDGTVKATVVEKLIENRLLVSQGEKGAATVEIAHEALLTSWTKLENWIKDNSQAIAICNRLNDDAAQWKKTNKNADLWSGSKLEQVLEFRENDTFDSDLFSKDANQFIDASVEWRDRQEIEKEEQTQREVEQETKEIRNFIESSKSLLVSNQPFDTLLESLKAAKKLKESRLLPEVELEELRNQVTRTLQQALIANVNEYNRIEGRTENITSVHFKPDRKMIATVNQDGAVKLWSIDGEELQTLPHKLPDNEVVAQVIFSPEDGQTIATVITDPSKKSSKRVKLWTMDGKELQRLPHDGRPSNVIFSPDGQMVATLSADYTVTLWNNNGEKLKIIPNHSFVYNVSFSPDSKIIAIINSDDIVTLWSTQGEKLKTLKHQDVYGVSFSPNHQMIATGSFDNNAKLWSIEGEELQTFPHDASVYTVSFSPDSQRIVTEDSNRVARLWSIDGGESKTLDHYKEITIVRFSPNGQTIATVGKDKIIKIWSHDGELRQVLTGHQARIDNISFSPDGQMIATASYDKTVKLWSINGQELETLHHDYPVKDVSFGSDGKTIVYVGKDNTVRFSSLNTLEFKTIQGHKEPVNVVSFSPDGQRIATASYDSTVKLWSRDGQELQTLQGHDHWIYDISFSPDGQMIVTGSHDSTVRLWSIDGKELQTLKPENYHAFKSVSFSPDGQTIAAGRFDGPVEIWSRDGEKLNTLTGHTDIVTSISFSPDGQTIATASRDRTVRVWSIDGKELKTLTGHNDHVITVSFSADGQRITSVSSDGEVKLWSRDGEKVETIPYNDSFESVSFSPDGKIIATTSGDNTVQLWSHDGQKLETLKGHDDDVMSVSFSPDGKQVATASEDNSVILWNLDVDKWNSLLDKDLDQLMEKTCKVVSDYLKKKPEGDSDRYLCD